MDSYVVIEKDSDGRRVQLYGPFTTTHDAQTFARHVAKENDARNLWHHSFDVLYLVNPKEALAELNA